VFANGGHAECEHGADRTHYDGVEEHRGLVRLTLLLKKKKKKKSGIMVRLRRGYRGWEGKTYEVAVGVAEWRGDGRHRAAVC
jgi:hypothetical protein